TKEWKRLQQGAGLTDGLLRQLEDLPDYEPEPPQAPAPKLRRPIANPIYAFFENEYAHIPKPAKFGSRSDMRVAELRVIGRAWFGTDWIEPLAAFLGYDLYHFTKLMDGDRRFIRLATEKFVREVQEQRTRKGGPVSLKGPAAQVAEPQTPEVA
ncbi:MAG TPA: hypothetical protein VMS01_19415, partial [Stellaceae bacterium]|nr:hypothetical protein [Stellaceae bacterium]